MSRQGLRDSIGPARCSSSTPTTRPVPLGRRGRRLRRGGAAAQRSAGGGRGQRGGNTSEGWAARDNCVLGVSSGYRGRYLRELLGGGRLRSDRPRGRPVAE